MSKEPVDPRGEPEVPTTSAWRAAMHRARKEAGLSQGRLGAMVGVSQVVISDIESGRIRSSSAVMEIGRALSIAPPMATMDPEIERLLAAAIVLRDRNPSLFSAQLMLLETLAGSTAPAKRTDH